MTEGIGLRECCLLFKSRLFRAQEQAIPKCGKSSKRGRRPAWLSRDLPVELRRQRKVYGHWKRGQATRQDYGGAVCHGRETIRAAKARLEFKLASTVKDKRKGFLKYVHSKRRSRDNIIGPLLDEVGHLANRDVDKAQAFNAAFASGFNTDDGPWDPGALCWKTVTGAKINSQPTLNFWRLAAPAGYTSAFGARWHSSQATERAGRRYRGTSPLFFNGLGSLERSQSTGSCQMLSQFSRRLRRKTLLITGLSPSRQCQGVTEKHLRDNAVIGPSQHGFARGKSCLTNLISFYDKVTQLVDQGKPGDGGAAFGVQQSFCYCLSRYPSRQNVQQTARQVQNTLGEQLADGSGSKGYSKRGYITPAASHQRASSGLSFRASALSCCRNDPDAGVECTGPLLPSPSGLRAEEMPPLHAPGAGLGDGKEELTPHLAINNFFRECWQALRRLAGPPFPAGGMSGCFAPSQPLSSMGGCATCRAPGCWRDTEDARPSSNVVATLSSRGHQAWHEEGAGAQGS